METKTQKFIMLFKEQKYKEALRIIKSFRKVLCEEDIRILNIAWECISGNESFYRQLGMNTDKLKGDAYDIMVKYVYGI